ncbi:MAG TPA: amidohydrolase family protein, partial [Candidatus Angelobacter sp.]|nr:amidohydrolase family protein [Candidatus Angelobacter sp.]
MNSNVPQQLLRAAVFHTPRNPFISESALEAFTDGALLIDNGRVLACGNFAALRGDYPQTEVRDLRGGFLLPGMVDTHIHFPQIRILGNLGLGLLDWLNQHALPEEARLADEKYARAVAGEFVHALAAHGTTTALVFGSHFQSATAALFETAERSGLRIVSGLVVS